MNIYESEHIYLKKASMDDTAAMYQNVWSDRDISKYMIRALMRQQDLQVLKKYLILIMQNPDCAQRESVRKKDMEKNCYFCY